MIEETIESARAYTGRLINLRVDTVRLPDGRITQREIVEHPGAVGILACDPGGQIVMVRQYRKPIERLTLEIPAGTLHAGEDPLACARRELREETGYEAKQIGPFLRYYSSAGFCNEILYLFHATELQHVGGGTDEDEFVELEMVSPQAAWQLIEKGEIVDGKTIIALLWLAQHKDAATA